MAGMAQTQTLKACYTRGRQDSATPMKYPFHTQSKPVVGEAAKKLIEAIDAGESITNDRALALAKRVASRILAASQPPSLQNRE